MSDAWRLVTSGPLSRRCNFRLATDGRFGLREVDALLARLSLEREWLAEDEASRDPFVSPTASEW